VEDQLAEEGVLEVEKEAKQVAEQSVFVRPVFPVSTVWSEPSTNQHVLLPHHLAHLLANVWSENLEIVVVMLKWSFQLRGSSASLIQTTSSETGAGGVAKWGQEMAKYTFHF
jgi:hypothetical protein